MNKYIGVVTFKIDIEATDSESAEYIAKQALPHHFDFSDGKGGSGKFLRGLMPVVYEQEENGDTPDSYWRNR
jgi:hypothetical protein